MGSTLILYCWIAVGSALGGVARYWCSGVAARLFGETFPWGTLFVNVTGSFIIGFFATLTGPDGRIFAGSAMRQFVMLGLLGGFLLQPANAQPRPGRRMVSGGRQYRRVRRLVSFCGLARAPLCAEP